MVMQGRGPQIRPRRALLYLHHSCYALQCSQEPKSSLAGEQPVTVVSMLLPLYNSAR